MSGCFIRALVPDTAGIRYFFLLLRRAITITRDPAGDVYPDRKCRNAEDGGDARGEYANERIMRGMRGCVCLKAVNYFILLITLRRTLRRVSLSAPNSFTNASLSHDAPIAITYNMCGLLLR